MVSLFDEVGVLGVILGIYGYGRVQWQRDFAKTYAYSILNMCSSSLMLISLTHAWNLAAFLSNAIWTLFSLYGVWRCWQYTRRGGRPVKIAAET